MVGLVKPHRSRGDVQGSLANARNSPGCPEKKKLALEAEEAESAQFPSAAEIVAVGRSSVPDPCQCPPYPITDHHITRRQAWHQSEPWAGKDEQRQKVRLLRPYQTMYLPFNF